MEDNFENTEELLGADAELPTEAENPSEEDDPLADFLDDENFDEESLGLDPSTCVIIRTTSGESRMVPVEGPTPVAEVVRRSGLAVAGSVEYWVNGSAVQATEEVAPGASITVVGVVKGG